MVYLNDTPFKGVFNAPDRLKHRSAVQQTLPTDFDGSTDKVWRHKNEFIRRMEATGLVSEFEVIIREHLRPPEVTEDEWTTDPRRFEKINFLLDYSVITLPLVKAMRDMILSMLAMMTRIPMSASQPGALELSSKQHRQWIAECLSNSWTATIKDTMDAYEEDHKGDGIVMWMCFLQEYAGSSREAIITAEEALHPSKLKLDNFQHNIKDCTTYCHENFRKIQAAGD